MSGGRDARLALGLLVLVAMTVVLVASSGPGVPEQRSSQPPRGDEVEAATTAPTARWTGGTRNLPGPARRVAARWAVAYTTSRPGESEAARLTRLRPYSTSALIASMGNNSGALALEDRGRTVGVVEAVQTQDSTPGDALLVLVERTVVEDEQRSTSLVSVTLEVVSRRHGWKVAEVLVP